MARCPHCDASHPDGTDFCPRTGRPIADVAERMIGRTIAGKYRLIRCIGQGGMGTVFEAEHALIGNRVAVKLLHQPFAERREPVLRLYREARATGAVGHPNIIQVYDVGDTEDGVPFLVMELLEGISLGEHIEERGPLPVGFVIEVGMQLLSALHAAHGAGIIHRDLKSDNIFLVGGDREHPSTKILDFGISKFTAMEDDSLKLTQTGSVLGTPYYMSPEQAAGKKDLDHRIDIFALGVILYESLLGTLPHTASNYNALLIEIITQDVMPFGDLRPDVPEELERSILKAMARDRNRRWESAVEWMGALAEIRERTPAHVLSGAPPPVDHSRGVDRSSLTLDVDGIRTDAGPGTPLEFESKESRRGLGGSARRAIVAAAAAFAVAIAGGLALVLSGLGGDGVSEGEASGAAVGPAADPPAVVAAADDGGAGIGRAGADAGDGEGDSIPDVSTGSADAGAAPPLDDPEAEAEAKARRPAKRRRPRGADGPRESESGAGRGKKGSRGEAAPSLDRPMDNPF